MLLWLDEARAVLLNNVRERLAGHVPGHELESVVAALGSKLYLSVRRLLDSNLEPDP